MGKCVDCGKESNLISDPLSLCISCIQEDFKKVLPHIRKVHSWTRRKFNLPSEPPKASNGISCKICANQCQIPEGEIGYCGLRKNQERRLVGAEPTEGSLSFYYDNLPTNCVADWVCPGGTAVGYPKFSYSEGPEYGYRNLAVFYQACSFNCLFCQNWYFRKLAFLTKRVKASELAAAVDGKTSCVCYFGGDPSPQLPHSLLTSRLILKEKKNRIVRICWETNGTISPSLLDQMVDISLESGGCIKFDLKAFDKKLHIALCGQDNHRTLDNFRRVAERVKERTTPPLLVASKLLVPGYRDKVEVGNIAAFIASLNLEIPYSLLAFSPQFCMSDLPTTSKRHAENCLESAKAVGLKRVRIGNSHLLGGDY